MIVRFGWLLVLLAVWCVALADVEVGADEIDLDNNTFVDKVPFQSECYCGLRAKSCSYDVEGRKKCICHDSYADNQGTCENCNCGYYAEYENECEFDNRGRKTCNCREGYAELDGYCQECDCGEYGSCSFFSGIKLCVCHFGFEENDPEKCRACYCGVNARCSVNAGNKQCDCNHGFAENDRGQCEECDCQMDDSNCTLDGGLKKCHCPKGFEPSKDDENPVCIDKDECLSPEDNDCDPLSTKCVNTRGSYDCVCREGFQIIYNNSGKYDTKKDGCKDIDECLDSSSCFHLHTQCFNTPGSYRCECTDGYSLEKSSYLEKYNYCTEDARPWKTASIVVGCLFGFVSLGLLIAICNRHCTL